MNAVSTQNRRKRALMDGRLIDITASGQKLGLSVEVAITLECWERCVDDDPKKLKDILECLQFRFFRSGHIADSVDIGHMIGFFAIAIPEGPNRIPTLFRLGVIVSAGPAAKQSLTVFVSEAW